MPQPNERHARSRWEWGNPPARADALRNEAAADPDPSRKAPARKDTGEWCKGKPGRPHQPAMVPAKDRRRDGCAWEAAYDYTTREHAVRWQCRHEEVCTACGKILRTRAGRWTGGGWRNRNRRLVDRLSNSDCPAYPGPPGQREAAERRVPALDAARQAREASWNRVRRRPPPITGPQGYRKKKEDTR